MKHVKGVAGEYGMSINVPKTQVKTNTEEAPEMAVGTGRLKQVNSFVYLGSIVYNYRNMMRIA